MSNKGITHPHSYKMMNLSKKNQANNPENSSSVLSNAITVQNLHSKVVGDPNVDLNPTRNVPIIFENIDMKQNKRPTTSRWNSNSSNLSNKLTNQFNSNFMKSDAAEKNKSLKSQSKSKVNNVYFNRYIDMQFRPTNIFQKSATTKLVTNPNLSNRDESYNFINPTTNEKFSNDKIPILDKRNVNLF